MKLAMPSKDQPCAIGFREFYFNKYFKRSMTWRRSDSNRSKRACRARKTLSLSTCAAKIAAFLCCVCKIFKFYKTIKIQSKQTCFKASFLSRSFCFLASSRLNWAAFFKILWIFKFNKVFILFYLFLPFLFQHLIFVFQFLFASFPLFLPIK